MFERKLRHVLTSSVLVTALCLTATASSASAGEWTRRQDGRRAAARAVTPPALSVWGVLSALWEKASVRIDPEGARLRVQADEGKASVRIDPEGRE